MSLVACVFVCGMGKAGVDVGVGGGWWDGLACYITVKLQSVKSSVLKTRLWCKTP